MIRQFLETEMQTNRIYARFSLSQEQLSHEMLKGNVLIATVMKSDDGHRTHIVFGFSLLVLESHEMLPVSDNLT